MSTAMAFGRFARTGAAGHWPDGHITTGLKKDIEDLKAMFAYAPETHIYERPVRIANQWVGSR